MEPEDQPEEQLGRDAQAPFMVEVRIPMKNHTGESFRNLVNICILKIQHACDKLTLSEGG